MARKNVGEPAERRHILVSVTCSKLTLSRKTEKFPQLLEPLPPTSTPAALPPFGESLWDWCPLNFTFLLVWGSSELLFTLKRFDKHHLVIVFWFILGYWGSVEPFGNYNIYVTGFAHLEASWANLELRWIIWSSWMAGKVKSNWS